MRIYPNGEVFFSTPKNFTLNSVDEFLKEFEVLFDWKDKERPNVYLDLRKTDKIAGIGLLLIYKIIDFTYQNHCFRKPNLLPGEKIEEAWDDYEFRDLINSYISNKDVTEKAYKDFKVKVQDQFIIAPQALLRKTNYTKEFLQNEFLPKISQYYNDDEKIVTIVFTCLSEILLNFWEHAVEDTKSIILAHGNKFKVEIACADTGSGIISTLLPLFPDLINKKEQFLAKCVQRGVTSKRNTFHMGYGLWIVDEIVKANRSRLHIYSEGYFYKNDYGKVSVGKCGYWRGTIVYINLDITKPQTLTDLQLAGLTGLNDLKIKFV